MDVDRDGAGLRHAIHGDREREHVLHRVFALLVGCMVGAVLFQSVGIADLAARRVVAPRQRAVLTRAAIVHRDLGSAVAVGVNDADFKLAGNRQCRGVRSRAVREMLLVHVCRHVCRHAHDRLIVSTSDGDDHRARGFVAVSVLIGIAEGLGHFLTSLQCLDVSRAIIQTVGVVAGSVDGERAVLAGSAALGGHTTVAVSALLDEFGYRAAHAHNTFRDVGRRNAVDAGHVVFDGHGHVQRGSIVVGIRHIKADAELLGVGVLVVRIGLVLCEYQISFVIQRERAVLGDGRIHLRDSVLRQGHTFGKGLGVAVRIAGGGQQVRILRAKAQGFRLCNGDFNSIFREGHIFILAVLYFGNDGADSAVFANSHREAALAVRTNGNFARLAFALHLHKRGHSVGAVRNMVGRNSEGYVTVDVCRAGA